jgi:hypothetical protein
LSNLLEKILVGNGVDLDGFGLGERTLFLMLPDDLRPGNHRRAARRVGKLVERNDAGRSFINGGHTAEVHERIFGGGLFGRRFWWILLLGNRGFRVFFFVGHIRTTPWVDVTGGAPESLMF